MANIDRSKSLRRQLRKLSEPIFSNIISVINLENLHLDENRNESPVLGISLRTRQFDSSFRTRKSIRKQISSPCGSKFLLETASDFSPTKEAKPSESDSNLNEFLIKESRRSSRLSRPSFRLNSSVHRKFRNALTSRKANYNPDSPTAHLEQDNPQSIGGMFPEHRIFHLSAGTENPCINRRSKPKRYFLRNFTRTSVGTKKRKRKLMGKSLRSKSGFRPTRSFSCGDVIDGLSQSQGPTGLLFGRYLEDVCDSMELPPKSIFHLLEELAKRGPSEIGIFRKSANVRLVRELKATLDQGDELISPNDLSICLISSLLKDFLRSLPDCLFGKMFYEDWLKITLLRSIDEKALAVQHLCSCIPGSHRILMKFFMYVLTLIAANSDINMMTPINLAVCVGPTLMNPGGNDYDYSSQVPEIIAFIIDNFSLIFGEKEIPHLENLLLFKNFESQPARNEYTHQFLSEENKLSRISLSRDSGISSDHSLFDDNCSSDFSISRPSTPVSCDSRDSVFSFSCNSKDSEISFDDVDGPVYNLKKSFQRNDWMRKGMKKKKKKRELISQPSQTIILNS